MAIIDKPLSSCLIVVIPSQTTIIWKKTALHQATCAITFQSKVAHFVCTPPADQ